MRKKRVVRIIHIGIHQPHADIIQKIEDDGLEVTEIIRQIILDYGKTNYPEEPLYAQAQKMSALARLKKLGEKNDIELMSNEEYVEDVLHGQVRDGMAVFRIGSGREIKLKLEGIKSKTIENSPLIRTHNEIINKTFTYNGRELTESQWNDVLDGWEDRRPSWIESQVVPEDD